MSETALQSERILSALVSLLETKRILITVGSGGVGKTTMAAALAMAAARLGRRTLVMTIDPARRLATSLGLQSLDNEQREVPAGKLAAAGLSPGMLHAMMLDQKRTFDELVRRYGPNEETVEKLLGSRIYQMLSSRLAGSQEYAAMEKLHAVWSSHAYDQILLDTPPTANALDFLDAPKKMVDAVESPAIKLFVGAYRQAGRLNHHLLGFGAAYVIKRLARFTGGDFLDDIAGFLADLSGLLDGMHERAAQVLALLTRPEVGFIVVTSPDPRAIDEAIGFHDRLEASSMALSAFVINMVHPLRPWTGGVDELTLHVRQATDATAEEASALGSLLYRSHEQMQALAQADAGQIQRLKDYCGEASLYLEVPLFNQDIHDVPGLLRVCDLLLSATRP